MDVSSISAITSMESFFATTINMFESLDIDNTLVNAGITHSSDSSYQVYNNCHCYINFPNSFPNLMSSKQNQLLNAP